MNVYLDTCAVNRLFDDRSQPRVREEAEAVEEFLKMKGINWITGAVLEAEINRNPRVEQRLKALDLIARHGTYLFPDESIYLRAEELAHLGYGDFDALHLATADRSCDFLLTTDDRFLRQVKRGLGHPRVLAMNPVNWIKEVLK